MDSYSSASGENLNIKIRKPYTITKQRERWTEDEHNRFLEALKLYGRAWQKIEEHIGTKTAVQIRSHAQKFFTKLEKETVANGVPLKNTLDIDIPPPRPKRKPNYPYPRKTRTLLEEKDFKQSTLVSSLQLLDLKRKPHPEKASNVKTIEEAENGTANEGSQEPPCASLSSENENSIPRSNLDAFRHDETNASYITIETRKHQELDQDGVKHTNITSNISLYDNSHIAHDSQGVQSYYPKKAPVQIVDANQRINSKTSVHESTVVNNNIAEASATSVHHNNATNQENCRSFIHFTSSVSSLIVSSLLQNPAAHAAATFAAKFYHPANTEASSADSFLTDQLNHSATTPSMDAIAAATVAAATAWWSAHGLLPVCTPFFPGGYNCTVETPVDGNEAKSETEKNEDLSVSDNTTDEKLNAEVSLVDANEMEPVVVVDSSENNVVKQVDRSSCGSNTISASEIETEKHAKERQENKGSDVNESVYRKGRSAINPNESRKEVSEEGRIAFQALFSREVLPKSFCYTRLTPEKDQQNIDKNSELEFDLNRVSQEPSESNGFAVLRGEEGVLRMGLGSVKLNVHHTGFKPYKRCSIEAKDSNKIMSAASTGGQNDEKGPKRMCFEPKDLR